MPIVVPIFTTPDAAIGASLGYLAVAVALCFVSLVGAVRAWVRRRRFRAEWERKDLARYGHCASHLQGKASCAGCPLTRSCSLYVNPDDPGCAEWARLTESPDKEGPK